MDITRDPDSRNEEIDELWWQLFEEAKERGHKEAKHVIISMLNDGRTHLALEANKELESV